MLSQNYCLELCDFVKDHETLLQYYFIYYNNVTVCPDTAETLTSRGVALVFEVEDICKATSLVQ